MIDMYHVNMCKMYLCSTNVGTYIGFMKKKRIEEKTMLWKYGKRKTTLTTIVILQTFKISLHLT